MRLPSPLRGLRSWLKQERLALRQPGWRTTLLLAVPLVVALVGLEATRRVGDASEDLAQQQQRAINLLQWLVGEQRRTTLDWAHWDNTLNFVEGRNPGFPAMDMDTTSLLKDGAVMAIWGPTGTLLALRGGTAADRAEHSPLQRCLDDVENRRRRSALNNLGVICPGHQQLYVGSIESVSDNAFLRRTNASLAYVVPLLTPQSDTPLNAALRQLQSELQLDSSAGGRARDARVITPPLWTTGGRMASVAPASETHQLLPELLPLAALVGAGGLILLTLRIQWMLGVRGQRLVRRRHDLNQSRRIRRMQQDVERLLEQVPGQGRAAAAGAFARLLEQQSGDGSAPEARGRRPEERLAARIEQILTRARSLVLIDSLTGLPNRTFFLEQLEGESQHCRSLGIPLALLFINIDKFKKINETYGHSVGDGLLQQIASELKRLVEPDDFLARFGGDEFALILSTRQLSSQSESEIRELAHQRALTLLDQFRELAGRNPERLRFNLSIGIALSDPKGTTPEELIRRSDLAMVIAKQRSSSQVSVFDIHCSSNGIDDYRLFNALESDLSHATDRFEVLFQPIVDSEGQILKVEALARWSNPDFPPISPDLFINLAERYRLIDKLGRLIIDRSLAQFHALRDSLNAQLQLAINISPSQLLQEGFGPWLLKQLWLHQVQPSAITVEVTESAVIETTETLSDNIASLRQAGVQLALDDFGTGFSSLRLLMGLRPDELKIDKSFVVATLHDPLALEIVQLLQQLAESLGLMLVAEGVEDAPTRDQLIRVGVRCFQGYLYARPERAEELLARSPNPTSPQRAGPRP